MKSKAKIHELITPETWYKGKYHTKNGAHCAVGWLEKVYNNKNCLALEYKKLADYIGSVSIIPWNDNPKRTFEEVYTAFKACDL